MFIFRIVVAGAAQTVDSFLFVGGDFGRLLLTDTDYRSSL
jgi:hypothetical protein